MTEVVNFLTERNIPEYDMMCEHGLFTEEKIKTIIHGRAEFQYKLSQNGHSLTDYGDFIIYEKRIHGWIINTEKTKNIRLDQLKMLVATRIVDLYEESTRKHPKQTRLWDGYIKFCKLHFPSETPDAYEKRMQAQSDYEDVWCKAGLWFHEQGNNLEKVKTIFFRGLQQHPESELLYTTFFSILLTNAAAQPIDLRTDTLETLKGIYNTAKNKVCRLSFLINLETQCCDPKYKEFCKPLQKMIINDMMDLYARKEALWDFLAQKELKGVCIAEVLGEKHDVPTPENSTGDSETNDENMTSTKPTLKKRIDMCFTIYQTAVETLETPVMWSMFINAMLELNRDLSTQQNLKKKSLALALRGAYKGNYLNEDHYLAYIDLLMETKLDRDFIIRVMTEATDKYTSLKLWERRLTFHVAEDDEPKVYETFRCGVEKLGANSRPLWDLVLLYYQTRYDENLERLIEIFEDACRRTEEPFLNFRLQYLEWSTINQPITETRALYLELLTISPAYLDLHKKMIFIESHRVEPDMEKIRQCYENAIMMFGTKKPDLWMDYIKFERSQGDPKRVTIQCERAKQVLSPTCIDNFITEFDQLFVTANAPNPSN